MHSSIIHYFHNASGYFVVDFSFLAMVFLEINVYYSWAGDGSEGGPPLSVSEVGEEKSWQDPSRK